MLAMGVTLAQYDTTLTSQRRLVYILMLVLISSTLLTPL